MNHDDFKAFFKQHYAIVRLDVKESGEKKALENPGGAKVMVDLKGEKAGLPFFAMLDANGKMVVNSIRPGEKGGNIGHPMQPEEVAHFMEMLKMTAPRAKAADLEKLREFLMKQKET